MLVVTTEGIPGYQVQTVIGEVVGVTARSFNPFVEGVKSLNGRLNPQLAQLLTQIRRDAVAELVEAAEARGANAVIGMRFDHRGVTDSWNEVCAYGTAVLVTSTSPALERGDGAAATGPGGDPAGSGQPADGTGEAPDRGPRDPLADPGRADTLAEQDSENRTDATRPDDATEPPPENAGDDPGPAGAGPAGGRNGTGDARPGDLHGPAGRVYRGGRYRGRGWS